jgi:hydroxylamine reductase
MFCNQCEEAANGTGCNIAGVCGKSGEVSDLQDKLILSTILIAKKGKGSEEENKFVMESLFATITNANFDDAYFKKKIDEAKELVEFNDQDLEEYASLKNGSNEDIKSLKELLLYGIKGIAAYLEHAYVLGYKDETIFAFITEGLISIADVDSVDELVALNLKCGEFGVKTMALLDKANTENFGNPEPTKVNIGVKENPGILISGHDLKDLKGLLEQTKGTGVDVYTHGEMLPANSYPEFKKYDNLVGNYGGAWYTQKDEFNKFNGPILMTTNCLVPPSESYKNRVYVTGVVGFKGLKEIPVDSDGNKDFSAMIEHAKKCASPEQIEEGDIMGGFAHTAVLSVADKIIEAVKSGDIKKFVVMAGCDGRKKERNYYTDYAKELPKDSVILTAGCAKYRYNKLDLGDIGGIPRVLDAGQCNDSYSLVIIAQKLAEAFELDDINKLPIAYNIAWYEQKAVLVLLSLLHLGVKNIHLGPSLPAFISSNVLKVLQDNFDIAGISTVEKDIKNMI